MADSGADWGKASNDQKRSALATVFSVRAPKGKGKMLAFGRHTCIGSGTGLMMGAILDPYLSPQEETNPLKCFALFSLVFVVEVYGILLVVLVIGWCLRFRFRGPETFATHIQMGSRFSLCGEGLDGYFYLKGSG